MKRLQLTYRRAADDTDRVAITERGYVLTVGNERTPVRVAVSELVAVRLLDDEAGVAPEIVGVPFQSASPTGSPSVSRWGALPLGEEADAS